MKRFYEEVAKEHFSKRRQMLFLMGPRQVGKTTTSLAIAATQDTYIYLNWDDPDGRDLILQGPRAVAKAASSGQVGKSQPLVVFDEIHKYGEWKLFLKGFYDLFADQFHVVVTGSARLDVFQRGGDSLMGRYLSYRFHPLTATELAHPMGTSDPIRPPQQLNDETFDQLLHFGGYPDPFLSRDSKYLKQWQLLRSRQLFREDLRDLTRIQELDRLEVLAEVLKQQVGQLTTYEGLARKLRVTSKTVRRWIKALKRVYYCYTVRPWSTNLTRALIKEPKFYLWDWSACPDPGSRAENFVASHLLKAVHFWTDDGFGEYELYFLRDKEKREVDFVVTRDGQPWILVEVKNGNKGLSPALSYYQKKLSVPHALQVCLDLPYVGASCFESAHAQIVPAKTFLTQLV